MSAAPALSPQPASGARKPAGRRRRMDLAIGVLLGLIIGLAVVSAFVFFGSEGAVDSPRLPSREAASLGAAGRAPHTPRSPATGAPGRP